MQKTHQRRIKMPDAIKDEFQQDLQDGDQEVIDTQQKEEKKKHEPSVDSPRWNELYWQKKEGERTIGELNKKLEDLVAKDVERDNAMLIAQNHQKSLQEALERMEGTISDTADRIDDMSEPDRDTDPKAHNEWIANKIRRDLEKKDKKRSTAFQHQPFQFQPQQLQQQQVPPGVEMQEIEYAAKHEDYYQVIGEVKAEMAQNPQLMEEFKRTSNPYEAAHRYGVARRKALADKRKALEDQAFVEENNQKKDNKPTLTDAEKYAAKMLNISEEKYLQQKIQIAEGKF